MSRGLLGGGHRLEFRHRDEDDGLVLILPVAGPRKGTRSLDKVLRTRLGRISVRKGSLTGTPLLGLMIRPPRRCGV